VSVDSEIVHKCNETEKLPAEELLMKPLAIPLGCQKTPAKWLVMAGHPKDGDISRWLTPAKYTRKGYAAVVSG